MNILISGGTGSSQFVRLGWVNALSALKHKAVGFYPFDKPVFDAFSETQPEVFFCGAKEISRAVYKRVKQDPKLRVGVWVEPNDDYKLVSDLADGQERFIVLAQTTDKFLDFYDKWCERFKVITVPPGIDSIGYSKPSVHPSLQCEVAYIGSYSAKESIYKYVLKACEKYKTKIYGLGEWPVRQHLGFIPNELIPQAYASAKACVSLSPTDKPYYIDESIFRILSAGSSVVAELTIASVELFKNHIRSFFSPVHFEESLIEALQDETDHSEWVLENHNYLERLKPVLEALEIM